MQTQVIPATNENVSLALAVLRAGGLVAMPTDTVYGLAADPGNEEAVQRLYAAKDRPPVKPIPLLFADLSAVASFLESTPMAMAKLGARYWPGALTIIVPAPAGIAPTILAGGDSVGIRVPDHPVIQRVLSAFGGPLAVTSANKSGEPSLVDPTDVARSLDGRIDVLLDGGVCPGGVASTVVDVTGERPRIVRSGPVTEEEIMAALEA